MCLQHIADASLSGLAVDTDDIRVVASSDIGRIDRQVGNSPVIRIVFFSPVHSLCDGILVRTGECRKHKRAAVRRSGTHLHAGVFLIPFNQILHIVKVHFRIHALHIQVHGKCDDVHISGPLPISEQSSLYAVRSGQNTKLRVADSAPTVVVRMQGENHVVPVLQVLAHILHLAGIDMRHGKFHCARKIDNCLPVCRRLPDIQNRVADFQRIFRLRPGKAFRAVLKTVGFVLLLCQFLQKLRSLDGYPFDLLLVFFEDLLTLREGGGVVHMHNGIFASLQRLKRLADDVLTGLCQHLHGDIVGNQIFLNQPAEKHIFCLGSGRETHLNFLKTNLAEQLEKLNFCIQIHGNYQRLIAVS